MLNALKNQLKLMAADPKDPFTSTIRKLVGAREAVHYEGPLRRMILAMPSMIAQIRGWFFESESSAPSRRLHGFAMAYLYSPDDLLPEHGLGLFGYLDDAYLVAKVYHRSMSEADSTGLRPFPEDEKLSQEVSQWIDLAKRLLPEETAAMDRMLDDAAHKRDGNFSELLSRAAKGGRAVRRLVGGMSNHRRLFQDAAALRQFPRNDGH